LPTWLFAELQAADLTEAEGPWPSWARTSSPIDWPTLVAAHPDEIGVDEDSLLRNTGRRSAEVAECWRWLVTNNVPAGFDVELLVDVDEKPGAIEVFLYELVAHANSDHHPRITRHVSLPESSVDQCTCGPNHADRRPKWIAPFIKGPEGAPLKKDRVHVWRR
jgi:hypothetical protein